LAPWSLRLPLGLIVGMVMVKTTNSCLQRLRDCRWLLLTILLISGIYALPELFIRNTTTFISFGSQTDMCLLGSRDPSTTPTWHSKSSSTLLPALF
ncbi:Uncharacterized protein FKW44_017889, partial [Caligus rogercresseyi]